MEQEWFLSLARYKNSNFKLVKKKFILHWALFCITDAFRWELCMFSKPWATKQNLREWTENSYILMLFCNTVFHSYISWMWPKGGMTFCMIFDCISEGNPERTLIRIPGMIRIWTCGATLVCFFAQIYTVLHGWLSNYSFAWWSKTYPCGFPFSLSDWDSQEWSLKNAKHELQNICLSYKIQLLQKEKKKELHSFLKLHVNQCSKDRFCYSLRKYSHQTFNLY